LALILDNKGFEICEVYARQIADAKAIIKLTYEAEATDSLDFRGSKAGLFIVAVKDDAIEHVAKQLLLPAGATVVHTSGTLSLAALGKALPNTGPSDTKTGVFYPLMTFSKSREVNFRQVPLCLEAIDQATEDVLVAIAKKLSDIVYVISSEERLSLHMAAVFSCNFTNHLWALAKEITIAKKLDFSILHPIIAETTRKALAATHPANGQTGPAIRKDKRTLERHIALLEDQPDIQLVYQTLTESIQEWH
jgi:predicted short-subunit dehydrogenase-like oxidoreductase (DUF2520 family)